MPQTMIQGFKRSKIITSISTFIFLASNLYMTFALYCPALTDDDPSPRSLACFAARIINIMLLCVGLVFIAMVAWAAYKLSMSNGDPKGFEGSKVTLTYTMIGGGVILGFFAIYIIMTQILGIKANLSPNAILDQIDQGIVGLLNSAGIN